MLTFIIAFKPQTDDNNKCVSITLKKYVIHALRTHTHSTHSPYFRYRWFFMVFVAHCPPCALQVKPACECYFRNNLFYVVFSHCLLCRHTARLMFYVDLIHIPTLNILDVLDNFMNQILQWNVSASIGLFHLDFPFKLDLKLAHFWNIRSRIKKLNFFLNNKNQKWKIVPFEYRKFVAHFILLINKYHTYISPTTCAACEMGQLY